MIGFAISGKARAGKSTVAEMIMKSMMSFGVSEENIVIAALANPMKHIAEVMFPEAHKESLYGASELRSNIIPGNYRDSDENPLTYRKFLLDLGAFGRRYNPDLWLNALVKSMKNNTSIAAHITVDCRFANELNYLKKEGYHMIRVLRDDHTIINDVSETEQDSIPNSEFDTVLTNNGSIDELFEKVQEMVKSAGK